MYVFKKAADLSAHLNQARLIGKNVGFVPTMGALHEGHISLVRESLMNECYTVASIFVNPTQFNNPSDLEKYPRTEGKDLSMLALSGVHAVFLPEVEEIYPSDSKEKAIQLDLGILETVMEGAFRPGHFAGVGQVVKRLLDIVEPKMLFMGQKDFQQLAVVRTLIKQYKIKTELVSCPTMREPHGLAMSSRNVRLPETQRKEAAVIYQTLKTVRDKIPHVPIANMKRWVESEMNKPGWKLEYFEIAEAATLAPLTVLDPKKKAVACIAIWVGDVRLIDNILIHSPNTQ